MIKGGTDMCVNNVNKKGEGFQRQKKIIKIKAEKDTQIYYIDGIF